jgi:hypothetical protein
MEEDVDVNETDPTIVCIVESQKNLFKKSMNVSFQGQTNQIKYGMDQAKVGTANNIDKLINNPILILLRILSDESNTTVPILKNLSVPLIKFIKFHQINKNDERSPRFI